jgi:hypothetical protein
MPARLAQQNDENNSPPTEGISATFEWQTGVGFESGKLSLHWTHPGLPQKRTATPPLEGIILGGNTCRKKCTP